MLIKNYISENGISFRPQIKPTQFSLIDKSSYLRINVATNQKAN
jgi:hypothetical protein